MAHGNSQQRNQKEYGEDQAVAHFQDMLFRCDILVGGMDDAVAGFYDRSLDFVIPGHAFIKAYAQGFRGQVYGRGVHSLNLLYKPLHAAGTGGTGHAADFIGFVHSNLLIFPTAFPEFY